MTTILTQGQTATFGGLSPNGSATLSFAQFDPSLGTLNSVVITSTIDLAGTATVENLQATPAQIGVTLSGGTLIALPGGTVLAGNNPTVSQTATLGAFDGAIDGVGSSGATYAALANSLASSTTTPLGTADLAAFTGTGTIGLSVTANTRVDATGGANLMLNTQAAEAGAITLQYAFTPAGGDGGSGGSSVVNTVNNPPVSTFTPNGSLVTPTQTQTVSDLTTDWTRALSFDRFDATLGTLEYISIALTGDLAGTTRLENLGPVASGARNDFTGTIALGGLAPGQTLSIAPTLAATGVLAAFDGTADFAGASGLSQSGTASSSGTITLSDTTDLAAFSGTGTIALPLTATARAALGGGADLLAGLAASEGAQVQLSYTYLPACYAEGTLIDTEHGYRPIETIVPGDRVTTHRGALVPVIWCGRRSVIPSRHPRPADVNPVHIAPHAFGPGLPEAELVLSPDHAVFTAGVLIPVRYLINDTTITQRPAARIVWHHLELPAHDVLVAEGLPAESYLDTGNRTAFEGRVMQLHPRFGALDPMTVWRRHACARLVLDGPELAAARRALSRASRETAAARR